ncbi:MAG: homoserine kinase [Pseudomonadota bacterium]
MAVFTTFSESALERYLVMYGIGDLKHYEAIPGGIENSNYFVTLENGDQTFEFVLTITENLSFEEAPFFNNLYSELSRKNLPVPNPERTLDGMTSTIFCGKPTWLFPRLPGTHPETVSRAQCEAIGAALASIHLSTGGIKYERANPYNHAWVTSTLDQVSRLVSSADLERFHRVADEYNRFVASDSLPAGIIHGDLFRDNTLFEGDELTGIIDFYHACRDYYAQDLAITINDWCTEADGSTAADRLSALLAGYNRVRVLSAAETAALPELRRFGALRFALTRLLSGSGGSHLKDPSEFTRLLDALD